MVWSHRQHGKSYRQSKSISKKLLINFNVAPKTIQMLKVYSMKNHQFIPHHYTSPTKEIREEEKKDQHRNFDSLKLFLTILKVILR